MFSWGKVSIYLVKRYIEFVDPAVTPGYPKYASFEHHQIFSFDSHALGLKHGTSIFIVKTFVERIDPALQKLYIIVLFHRD